MSSTEPILTMRGIEKSFGAEVKALKGVDFEVRPGEIVALLGENGAGKSTLLKAITGVHTPTAGEVRWFGEPVVLDSPAKARDLGIRTVYQELNLAPHLSVAANIYLGAELMRKGLLDHKAMREKAQALLSSHGFDLNPDALVGTLGPAQRQAVEICKALSEEAKLLLLDEPTSSLGEKEIEELFSTLRALRERGIGMVFVSHRLPECFALCDRVVVLRDGLKVYEATIRETDTSTVVRAMVGRELSDFYPRVASEPGKPRLQVDLTMEQGVNAHIKAQVQGVISKYVEDVSAPAPHLLALGYSITFTAHAGEVVGIAGLMGAGRTELLEAIFGLRHMSGSVFVDGKPLPLNQGPRAAIKAGVGMLTEDRKRTGLALGLPVRHNVTLAGLEKIAPGPWLAHGPDKAATQTEIERLRIKTSSTETLIGTLSGGNQQKGVLGRWLHAGSSVLLFDEPTRGVDVGSKVEIYEQMNLLTQSGATIVLVSSELPELLGMSDRILVLFQGRLVADIARADATPDRVLHFMMTGKDIAL